MTKESEDDLTPSKTRSEETSPADLSEQLTAFDRILQRPDSTESPKKQDVSEQTLEAKPKGKLNQKPNPAHVTGQASEKQAVGLAAVLADRLWQILKQLHWGWIGLGVISAGLNGLLIGGILTLAVLLTYSKSLEDYKQLSTYEPPVASRIYANDGRLLRELATENRFFVPIELIPPRLRQAFISAEDKTFYTHTGFDAFGIARAVVTNLTGGGNRLVGASTITQQVAKNFLLTSERTLTRKIKEAILTVRIENTLEKSRILELYLNQIYLGSRSYGIAAAAQGYFNKRLDELTLGEMAYLAGVPKAPNRYHPARNPEGAMRRRAYVLKRMLNDDAISEEDYQAALAEPLVVPPASGSQFVEAEYFAEEIRRSLIDMLGDGLYTGGYSVLTTLDPKLQRIARQSLRQGLKVYDRRHGWHGVLANLVDIRAAEAQNSEVSQDEEGLDLKQPEGLLESDEDQSLSLKSSNDLAPDDMGSDELASKASEKDWLIQMRGLNLPQSSDGWELATVLDFEDNAAILGLDAGDKLVDALDVDSDQDFDLDSEQERQISVPQVEFGRVELKTMGWARQRIDNGLLEPHSLGPKLKSPSDILRVGDVVYVSRHGESKDLAASGEPFTQLELEQTPEVQGALVVMEPGTGRVLALVGGYTYSRSEFNRATQAKRQPGSAFKPFVYLTALEKDFTPSSLVLDAPMEIPQKLGEPFWRPKNYSGKYYGPTPLRVGLESSRNLMTVRLAKWIGMKEVSRAAKEIGIYTYLRPLLSFSLGASETTLLRLAIGYSTLVNGGREVTPKFIERIQDRAGKPFGAAQNQQNLSSVGLNQTSLNQASLETSEDEFDNKSAVRLGENTGDLTCSDCDRVWSSNMPFPEVIDHRNYVADPISSYQIVHMLQGAVERGTGRGLKSLGVPLAGKTGTTNENVDAWFFGLSQGLVVGAYVGFDQPRPMGIGETGSKAALPIVKSFLEKALAGQSVSPFVRPSGVRLVQVNARTGMLPDARSKGPVIWEAFRPGTEPRRNQVAKMLDLDAIVDLSAIDLAILRGELKPDAAGSNQPRRATGSGTGGQY